MPKYPISTILYLAKLSIKDKIQDALKLTNNVDAYITIELKDKNGNIIKRHKQHSHSFVAQFLSGLQSIANSTALVTTSYWNASQGIQIGTGTGTPEPTDTALFNLIANGTGAGQMVYPSSITVSSVVINGKTSSFTIQSTITNNSGSPITVTEVGINGSYNYPLGGLQTHDLLSSPITVPNGTAITITYTISVTT